MRPERFSNSDADFNVGMAVATIQLSQPGFIGICMNGLVIPQPQPKQQHKNENTSEYNNNIINRDLATGQFLLRRSSSSSSS